MSKKTKGKKLDADLDLELDEYEPSDSEGDYSEEERLLLDSVRKKNNDHFEDDSEEEVLGLGSGVDDEDDSDEQEEHMESGEEGQDDLPDSKAWGRKKKNFYNTDYVDQDYGGGFQKEEEEEAARLEEEEAREIQRRLASQLDDDDYGLGAFVAAKSQKDEAKTEEVITTDLSKLSKRQKIALLQKEAPEFFGVTEDFTAKMTILKEELEPLMVLIKNGKIPSCMATKLVTTLYHLILNYCCNSSFYLLLKSLRIPVSTHPVAGRLARYRRLLEQAEAIYRETVQPQIADVLAADWENFVAAERAPEKKQKKRLKLLSKRISESGEESGDDEVLTSNKKRVKRTDDSEKVVKENKKAKIKGEMFKEDKIVGTSEEQEEESNLRLVASDTNTDQSEGELSSHEKIPENERRAITYQIAKNKGLTPYRKKEVRNPRVRHRRKYEKARVRRKGQVREPRKEVTKYGGEISGIKIGITKSVKLKV